MVIGWFMTLDVNCIEQKVIEERCNMCIAEVVWNVFNICSLIADIAKGNGGNS